MAPILKRLATTLVMLLALSACSLPVFYRVPIVQGNVVTTEQVNMLHNGMTRKQVAYVLGTPLIESPFETNRWDYVFYYRNPRAHVRESVLSLYFANDQLSSIKGGQEHLAQALKNRQETRSHHAAPLPGETAAAGAHAEGGGTPQQPEEQPQSTVPRGGGTMPAGPGQGPPSGGPTPPTVPQPGGAF